MRVKKIEGGEEKELKTKLDESAAASATAAMEAAVTVAAADSWRQNGRAKEKARKSRCEVDCPEKVW